MSQPPFEMTNRTALFGRSSLLQHCQELIAHKIERTRLLLVQGVAGAGKTRLTEEIQDGLKGSLRRYLPLYDFYHIDRFKASSIEDAIIASLAEPGSQDDQEARKRVVTSAFKRYTNARKKMETARQSGQQFEQAQKKVRKSFVTCYNALVKTFDLPMVLLFDTVEQAVNLADGAEDRLIGRSTDASEGGAIWLREMLPQLRNTVVMVLGRPQTLYGEDVKLYEQLRAKIIDHTLIDLPGLDHTASQAFVAALRDQMFASGNEQIRQFAQDIDLEQPSLWPTWFAVADGLPFWLSVLFTCEIFGVVPPTIDAIRDQYPTPGTDNSAALTEKQHAEWRNTLTIQQAELRDALMRQLFTADDQKDHTLLIALRWLGHLRKGASLSILQALIDHEQVDGLDDAEALFEQLQKLTLVKRREVPRYLDEGSTEKEVALFLHDELYAWLDRNPISKLDTSKPIVNQVIGWYDARIAQVEAVRQRLVQQSKKRSPNDPAIKQLDAQRDAATDRIRMLVLDRIGYFYQRDLDQGTVEYNLEAYAAIVQREAGYGVMLRQEALRNYYRADRKGVSFSIEMECAARWILRTTFFNEDKKALELLEKLDYYWERQTEATPQARAFLYFATAVSHLMLQPQLYPEQVAQDLRNAQQLLVRQEALQRTNWIILLQHLQFAWQGYMHRLAYDLVDAIDAYSQANKILIPNPNNDNRHRVFIFFIAVNLQNLAFAISEQGDVDAARELALTGLDANRRYGSAYSAAMSLNTLARIEIRAGRPDVARRYSDQALAIIERYQSARGFSLCLPVSAEIRRKLAEQTITSIFEQEQFFEQAEALVINAEPYAYSADRRREVKQGRGCLYRSWAKALYEREEREERETADQERLDNYFAKAYQYLMDALEIAEKNNLSHLLQMDILEDIATNLIHQDIYDQRVLKFLDRAEQLAPPGYRLERGESWRDPKRPTLGYWRELGQCQLQRMMVGFGSFEYGWYAYDSNTDTRTLIRQGDESDLRKAAEAMLLMFVYLDRYNPVSTMLERAKELTLRELRRLKQVKELQLLEIEVIDLARLDYNLGEGHPALRIIRTLTDKALEDIGVDPVA
jgi:hypothetical protein